MRRLAPLALCLIAAACGGDDPRPGQPNPADEFETQQEAVRTPQAEIDGRYRVARLRSTTALRRTPRGRVIARLKTRTEFDSPRVLGVLRSDDDWLRVTTTRGRGWIPARRARVYGTDMSLHVDRSERRLVLRRDGRVVLSASVAVGRPDTPTPLGRFAVTDRLAPKRSDSPYGCCLLALNGHQSKLLPGWPGGDRLAIHATPATWSIGQEASLGCVRVLPKVARRLLRSVPLGTPVFIRS